MIPSCSSSSSRKNLKNQSFYKKINDISSIKEDLYQINEDYMIDFNNTFQNSNMFNLINYSTIIDNEVVISHTTNEKILSTQQSSTRKSVSNETFTPEEDEILLENVKKFGFDFEKISGILKGKSLSLLRKRYNKLVSLLKILSLNENKKFSDFYKRIAKGSKKIQYQDNFDIACNVLYDIDIYDNYNNYDNISTINKPYKYYYELKEKFQKLYCVLYRLNKYYVSLSNSLIDHISNRVIQEKTVNSYKSINELLKKSEFFSISMTFNQKCNIIESLIGILKVQLLWVKRIESYVI